MQLLQTCDKMGRIHDLPRNIQQYAEYVKKDKVVLVSKENIKGLGDMDWRTSRDGVTRRSGGTDWD